MKRKKLIIAAVSVVLLLGIVLTGIFFEKPPENTVCLFDDFFIYRSNNKKCEIYEKDVYVEDLGYKANKEIFSGWLYKYSYDANRGLIAVRQIDASETKNNTEPVLYYRYFENDKYAVNKDVLRLYDKNNDKYTEFETDEALKEYCRKNDIVLSDWYYPAGNGFVPETNKELVNGYRLKTWLYGYSSIMCGEKEIIFGYISNLKVKDNVISFRLKQSKNEYSAEQIDANRDLSPVGEKPAGLHRNDFLNWNYVYYNKKIEINTLTGIVTEK